MLDISLYLLLMPTYSHPRPALTADVVLLRSDAKETSVLLIRRAKEPFAGCWALPGGFVDENESLEKAARRELKEETGLEADTLVQIGAFGDPGRDPRGHTVSVVYAGFVSSDAKAAGSDDASDARWFVLGDQPDLAFDHAKILDAAIRRLMS